MNVTGESRQSYGFFTTVFLVAVAVVIALTAAPATSFAYEETTGYAKSLNSLNDPSVDDYKLLGKTKGLDIQLDGDGTIYRSATRCNTSFSLGYTNYSTELRRYSQHEQLVRWKYD